MKAERTKQPRAIAVNDDVALEPRPQDTIDFMRRLDADGRHFLVAIGDNGPVASIEGFVSKKSDVKAFVEFIERHNSSNKKRSVYISVNEPREGVYLKAGNKDIVAIRALHVDIDAPKIDPSRADAILAAKESAMRIDRTLAKIKRGTVYEASEIIRTGDTGGAHVWLYLQDKEPVSHGDDSGNALIDLVTGMNDRLRHELGGDKTIDPSRILRPPGTINWPNAAKAALGRKPFLAHSDYTSENRFTFPMLKALYEPTASSMGRAAGKSKLRADDAESLETLEFADEDSPEVEAARKTLDNYAGDDADFASIWTPEEDAEIDASTIALGPLGRHMAIALSNESDAQVAATLIREWMQAHSKNAAQNTGDRFIAKAMTNYKAAVIARNTNPFGDGSGDDSAPRKSKNSFTPMLADQVADEYQVREFIVRDIIPPSGVSVWYGDSQTLKTFCLIDAAASIAGGQDWFGRVTQQTGVAIWAGEGFDDFGSRTIAWRKANDRNMCGVTVFCDQLAIFDDNERKLTAKFEGLAEFHKAKTGLPLGVVFIDTASVSAGSMNESDNSQVAEYIARLGRIGRTLKISFIVIAHTGKDKERGARGANAWFNNADCQLVFDRDGNTPLKGYWFYVKKMKQGANGLRCEYDAKIVEVGKFKNSDTRTSLVILPGNSGFDARQKSDEKKRAALTGLSRDVFETVKAVAGDANAFTPWDDVFTELAQRRAADNESEVTRDAAKKARSRLTEKGFIEVRRIDGKTHVRMFERTVAGSDGSAFVPVDDDDSEV